MGLKNAYKILWEEWKSRIKPAKTYTKIRTPEMKPQTLHSRSEENKSFPNVKSRLAMEASFYLTDIFWN